MPHDLANISEHPSHALRQCPPPKLDWSRPGTPSSIDFGDVYFSTEGGLAECETVFLKGCGLPEGWQNASSFTIAELGFGSGLNFLTTWRLWDRTKAKTARLHFISIEKFPFAKSDLHRALGAWPELAPYSQQLCNIWPGRVKGFHRLHFNNVTLTLIHDDVKPALQELDADIDAWFLDGFNPAKNSEMWSSHVMAQIAHISAPNARLATFTVAGFVRQALIDAGFEVEKKKGFGRKRHRLEARYSGPGRTPPTQQKKSEIKLAIIGNGIAGQSLRRAFERRGIRPDIFYDETPSASGNPAALVKPRFDLQDRPESRFFLAAYLYALNHYHEEPYKSAIRFEGVCQLATDPAQCKRFENLAKQAPLSADHLDYDVTCQTLQLGRSLVINPQKLINPDHNDLNIIAGKVTQIETLKNGFRLHFANGTISQPYSHICLAAGFGVRELCPAAHIRFSRGQLSWAQKDERLSAPLTYGGYALPLDTHILLGATHAPLQQDRNPFTPIKADDEKNFAQFENANGFTLTPDPNQRSRASVRVTTQNTLPLMDEISPRLWRLSGLGSRGFVFAPLLSEALASYILGEPSPLSKKVRARFEARETSNHKARSLKQLL